MNNPLISVIVPVYKVEKYLGKCIDTVLAQSYTNFELILVEDGSPDLCGKICDAYAKKDHRIRVIHKENAGLSDARNAGLDAAGGAYIYLLDSDDYIHPDTLQRMYEEMKKTGSDMALCNIQYVDQDEQPMHGQNSLREYCVKREVWTQERFWSNYQRGGKIVCVVAWNKLYRRELFADLRYPKGKVREDEFLIHHIVARCTKICCVDKKLCNYRQRQESTMAQAYQAKQMDAVEAYLDRAAFYNRRGDFGLAELAFLDAIAFLCWYEQGMNRADQKAAARYAFLKKQVCSAGKKQMKKSTSLLFCLVMGLYRKGLFPYAFLKRMWGGLEQIRQLKNDKIR